MFNYAWLSKELDNSKVLCEACSHSCVLSDSEYGICGVRKVQDGELKLLVYGLVSALNVDPIEKKPMFHFLPNTKIFSIGTVGCNLSCNFCQNHEISQYPKENNHEVVGHKYSPENIIDLAIQNGCKSIAYTYNEPIVFFEYTYDIAKLAHQNGLKNIYVTSGYETHKAIDLLKPYIDGMNIDIKSFNNDFYKEICGAKLKPVLDTVKYAYKKGIWIEITTLLIEGQNDSDEEIRAIAKFLADIDESIPWHISAFHPMYKMLNTPRTTSSTLHRAYNIAKEVGLNYVYIGNVDDVDYESSYCPECKKRVINRRGNVGQFITNFLNSDGICPNCKYKLQGIWS
jgi:pyruvate formate lyase activating enzyme